MLPDHSILLIDLGNTRLKWCASADAGGSPAKVDAIAHAQAGAAMALRTGLQSHAWRQVWIASVGPEAVLADVERACAECLPGVPVQRARSLATCGDLRNGYDAPSQLGVDRFLALLAARARWPGERVLLASIGSAVTIDLLERDGAHAGGLIAPSSGSMHRALGDLAAQLVVDATPTGDVFARATGAGIASGCTNAVAGLVERCFNVAAAQGAIPLLVLSGGCATELAPNLSVRSLVVPFLVLDGLARYARMQSGAAGVDADR